jgi:tetratricopeptide (TPR) repeat protein
MLERVCAAALLASLLAQSGSARAEAPVGEKPRRALEVPRDPRGIRGISAFTKALRRGDSALLARDFAAAVVAYRDAIEKEPENALGYYRLGEAQLIKNDLQAAEEAFSAGLRAVPPANSNLTAKLQFALADLRERQKAYDEALAKWTEYEALTTAQNGAHGFPSSGSERRKAIETWKKLSASALEVKTRIEKGVQGADESVKKSSK